jgi:hypothetical protein
VVRPIFSFVQQNETHRQLVGRPRPGTNRRTDLDAIVVPASRSAEHLTHAVDLAKAVNCRLVVFCSRQARAADVSELLAAKRFRRGVVVDLPPDYGHRLLEFRSSEFTHVELPKICENPNGDLSTKRNLGLLLARMRGWERIFFMDDDIRNVAPEDLHATVSMLGRYRSVGMRVIDFPDNSVVCHAHRATGGTQDIFVSGSVLAVNCPEDVGFFPEVYNEDWLFFYDDARSRKLGWSGRNAAQLHYDPFRQPRRAEREEFGDVLAEGLYALLDLGGGETEATQEYWTSFLDARWRFLDSIIKRSEQLERDSQAMIIGAIETAQLCLMQIQPSMFEHYVKIWREDIYGWMENVDSVPRVMSVKSALAKLGLNQVESGCRERSLFSVPATLGRYLPSSRPPGPPVAIDLLQGWCAMQAEGGRRWKRWLTPGSPLQPASAVEPDPVEMTFGPEVDYQDLKRRQPSFQPSEWTEAPGPVTATDG